MSEHTPAPRGHTEGDWWLVPISRCCGFIMTWVDPDFPDAGEQEWHGNPNDYEPERLLCYKCEKQCWPSETTPPPSGSPPVIGARAWVPDCAPVREIEETRSRDIEPSSFTEVRAKPWRFTPRNERFEEGERVTVAGLGEGCVIDGDVIIWPFRDCDGYDHHCVRCDDMADSDCENKYPGEKGTCCVCVGHECADARREREIHPKQND